jgi:hypothetical protein
VNIGRSPVWRAAGSHIPLPAHAIRMAVRSTSPCRNRRRLSSHQIGAILSCLKQSTPRATFFFSNSAKRNGTSTREELVALLRGDTNDPL